MTVIDDDGTAGRSATRPLRLGRNGRTPVVLRNRLASAPMERNYGTTDGRVTEQYIDYLVARARAGVALVTTEATFVRADGKGRTHQLGLHDDASIPSHRALTDALHAEGALAAVEINHGGRTAQSVVSGFPNVAPSPVACLEAGGEQPQELSIAQCHELVQAYADGARRAVAAGFDVISIHGAHGYLIHQFMSPLSNHRTDEFAAPERFLNLVIDAVRAAAPNTVVGLRISMVEGPEGGITAEQQTEIVAAAHLEQLDFLDLSAGSYQAGEWIVQSGEWKPGVLAELAAGYRGFGLPLGMAGRMNSPTVIEEVLDAGVCDFVSLARALHADPMFAAGVLRGQRYRPCIACNVCIDNLGAGQVTCTMNPTVGRSRVPVPTPVVPGSPRVVVVGAGPAGLTAGRELAEAGARVSIVAAEDRLGGDFALAQRMDSTPDFHRFTDWSGEEIQRLGIELLLDQPVEPHELPALVRDRDADAVVLATGGAPATPDFPGADHPEVSEIRDWLRAHPEVLDGTGPPPEAVTIWGADSVAMSAADTLASQGTAVLLVGAQTELAPESGRRAKILAVPRLRAAPNVRLHLDSRIVEHTDGWIRVTGPGGEQWLEAPGDLLVSQSVRPVSPAISREGREAALSRAAGVPVVLAGSLVEQGAPTASIATKSGYDAAQHLAALLRQAPTAAFPSPPQHRRQLGEILDLPTVGSLR